MYTFSWLIPFCVNLFQDETKEIKLLNWDNELCESDEINGFSMKNIINEGYPTGKIK